MDGILPVWATWTPLAAYALGSVVACLAAAGVAAWVTMRPFARARDTHWTERARLAHGVRLTTATSALVLPAIAGFGAAYAIGPLAALPPVAAGALCALFSFAACLFVRYRCERALRPGVVTAAKWARGAAALTLIRLPHVVVAVTTMGATLLVPPGYSALLLGMAAAAALGLIAAALGGGTALARTLGLVTPATTRLAELARQSAALTGTELRGAFEARMPIANAFALPLRKWIVVTDQALLDLDDAELTAVIAHELGHLREAPRTSVARVAPMTAFLLIAFLKPIVEMAGLAGLLAVAWAIVLSLVWARRVGRRMEEHADTAATHQQAATGVYARALEKLYASSLIPAVMPSKRMVHPHLYDRMVAAGSSPSYPRPAPPRWPDRLPGQLAGVVTWFLLAGLFSFSLEAFSPSPNAPLPDLIRAIAWSGGSSAQLADLARRNVEQANLDRAFLLYGLAADHDPSNPSYPASLALLFAREGACNDAEDELLFATTHRRASRGGADDLERARKAIEVCHRRKGTLVDEDEPPEE